MKTVWILIALTVLAFGQAGSVGPGTNLSVRTSERINAIAGKRNKT
jgi:hypothetical protein